MATKPDATLEDVAAELYALPLKEFTAARNARAKQTSDAGLGEEIRALRKPQLSAWVVNLFARERSAEMAQALDLASDLRDAQDDLDARALTALGRQRRALVRALAQQASEHARERGEKISQATTDAVEQTLNAAMFHAEAAAAVASGRLIRPLDPSGDDLAELPDAVAGHFDASPASPADRPSDEVAARRERKAAEAELRAAQADASQAERENDARERKWDKASEHADRLVQRVQQLKADLARVEKEAEQSMRERDALEAGRAQSRERVDEAQRAVAAAQSALDRL